MRAYLFFLSFLIGWSTFAFERGVVGDVIVDSVFVDGSLKSDQRKVSGKTIFYQTNLTAPNIGIKTQSGLFYSDSLGNFEILLTPEDSLITFWGHGYASLRYDVSTLEQGEQVVLKVLMTRKAQITVRKPVIYLYSEKEEFVSLSLLPNGPITFTYPLYSEGWDVTVNDSGIVHEGNTYPYLFWEGEMDRTAFDPDANRPHGWVIASDTVVSFLEAQLTALGLNRTEQTDFITFWAPRLQQQSFQYIRFIVDEQYDQAIAGLDISPQPDVVRRVYMVAQGADEQMLIQPSPQVFTPIERKGFVLIEWGGSDMLYQTPSL